ncbi:hypothetical protein KAI04_00145 [Candidatus Pacearchaeota archaeon]|nr:hypothetical protein [Candidatus Pacearchaeota archaeon]
MTLTTEITEAYNLFIASLPQWAQSFISFFLLAILILIYAIFIWKFYRWISTKNLLELNLNKYNKSQHPATSKMLAGIFYLLEYIIILPFLIFFWFLIFTIFLLVLTEGLPVGTLLIISATIIAAIRMTAYYNEDLSKDLAKLVPFTLLGVSIINPDFFNIGRIISQVSEIPQFITHIAFYLIFIVGLEIVLRIFEFAFSIFNLSDEEIKPQVEQTTQ